MNGLDVLRAACEDPFAAARAAKAGGQRVVAYLGTSVPVELIRASGAFAFQLAGDPKLATPLSDLYLDDQFDGDVRALFDMIGGGACDVADLIIIPRASNGLLYLYDRLLELRRLEPQRRFPEVLLYDVLNTAHWTSDQYVLNPTEELHTWLGGSEHDVYDEIGASNGMRRTLHALNLRRRAGRLLGSTWWTALRAARVMEPGAWHAAISAMQDENAPVRKLLLKGDGQDTPTLYLLAESLGANIVADDHVGGERTVRTLLDERSAPLSALAEHYRMRVPTIRSWPQAQENVTWRALLADSGARAVLFYHEEFEDTLGWEYPAQKAGLDAAGVPYALLRHQSYRTPDRATQLAVMVSLIERIAP